MGFSAFTARHEKKTVKFLAVKVNCKETINLYDETVCWKT